jgi:thiopurine S-methyltransferase
MQQTKQWYDRWKNNKIGFHQDSVNVYLKKYVNIFKDNSTVFVPFCGKSIDMLYLRDIGKDVVGIELVSSALDSFVRENSLHANISKVDNFIQYDILDNSNCPSNGTIKLLCGNFFDLKKQHLQNKNSLDIFDRASLVALNKQDRVRYVDGIKQLLEQDSRVLLVSLDYDDSIKQGPPYSVSDKEIKKLYGDVCEISLLDTIDLKATSSRYDSLSYMYENIYLIKKI